MIPQIRVPSDVVTAILCKLGQKERFPADMPEIYKVFYDISKNEEFSELFNDFVFDESQAFPRCSTVQFAFDTLQNSGMLECINPDLSLFEVSQDLASEADKLSELFNEKEVCLLDRMAEVFKVRMSYNA